MTISLYLNYRKFRFRFRSIIKNIIRQPDNVDVDIQKVIKNIIQKGHIKNVLQVGSNDGLKNDPLNFWINNFELNVILIEPLEDNFLKLKENYASAKSQIHFEQIGISDRNEEIDYYYLKDIQSDEPDWYDQIGSFDYSTFLSNISVDSQLLSRIGKRKIICKQLETLLEEQNWKKLDFLHVDAEGLDYIILNNIDLKSIHPMLILFETDWMKLYELKHLKNTLLENKYSLFMSGIDCIAISNSILTRFI
jgi:FkbM family methyltransferase